MRSNGSALLSFLDLLTCCLGGMLLLFFVVVLIRQRTVIGNAGTEQTSSVGTGQSGTIMDGAFCLITIKSRNNRPLPNANLSWKLTRHGREISQPPFVFQSSADRYAVFYATRSLSQGTELWFRPVDGDTIYEVNIYSGDDSSGPVLVEGPMNRPVFFW